MLAMQLDIFKLDFEAINTWVASKSFFLVVFLFASVISSSLAVSYQKYWSMDLNRSLQVLTQEKNNLQVEWRQLLVEQSTWGSSSRVSRIAIERHAMHVPKAVSFVLVPA